MYEKRRKFKIKIDVHPQKKNKKFHFEEEYTLSN